jgi:hypothetical protein
LRGRLESNERYEDDPSFDEDQDLKKQIVVEIDSESQSANIVTVSPTKQK